MEFQATKEQLEIIMATEGAQRCAAVPGAGKTRVLTNRIAYLIKELFIAPESIFALTFTNKAASEMKKRVKALVGDDVGCFIGTFHGLCNRILKEECFRIGWPKTFVILDKKDQINLVREIATEMKLTMTDVEAKKCLDSIQQIKSKDLDYVKFILEVEDKTLIANIESAREDMQKVIYAYYKKQRDSFLMDFTDMMQFTRYIFNHNSEVSEKWQERCQYVLCDEFQDVSGAQLELLLELSKKYGNIFVVGDDDQLIYGWREAKPEYMLRFFDRFPEGKDYFLTENFRSTPEIIAVANSLINKNVNRIEKMMFTNNPSGAKPVYSYHKSDKDEALWVAERILEAVTSGKQFIDHAILVRAASQTRQLEEAFVTKSIPYKIYSGAMFYATEEIKTTLSYLRMVYSLSDIDFEQTINRPSRKFGKKSLANLKEYAKENGWSLIEALGEQIKTKEIKKQPLIDYYWSVVNLHDKYQELSSKDLVNKVLEIGYLQYLQEDVDQTKLDNVTELISTITALEEENEENIPLEDLLAHFALFSNQDEDTDAVDVVKIMTIHTAKGLEFDTVFVNGLVEGQFPSSRLRNLDEMEEERRLLYVAITRAKTMLYLSCYGFKPGLFDCAPSRFINNIEQELLYSIGGKYLQDSYADAQMLPKKEFEIGDKIEHRIFGIGEIVGIDDRAQFYEIKFDGLETVRKIQFRARLDKII